MDKIDFRNIVRDQKHTIRGPIYQDDTKGLNVCMSVVDRISVP